MNESVQQQRVDQAIKRRDKILHRMNRHDHALRAAEREHRRADRFTGRRPSPERQRRADAAGRRVTDLRAEGRRLGDEYQQARQDVTGEIRSLNDPRQRKHAFRQSRQSHIKEHFRSAGQSTRSKGVLGERLTDDMMRDQGFTFVGSADRPVHGRGRPQGIDSVWERNGKYFVVESKWGKSRRHHTRDGRQASANWTMGRLEAAVGRRKANQIAQRGYYVYEVRANRDGTMQRRNITNAGHYRARRDPIRRNAPSSLYPRRNGPAADPARQDKRASYGGSVRRGNHRAARTTPKPVQQRQASAVRVAPPARRK